MRNSAAIMRAGDVGVLPVTVWEIARKVAIGKLPPLGLGLLSAVLERNGFTFMPLTWADAEAANDLPDHHRDPMDRMLIATALRTNMTVITTDRIFEAYGVRTVW